MKSTLRVFFSDPILPLARVSPCDDESFLEKNALTSSGVLELVSHIKKQCGIRTDADEVIPDDLDSLNNLSALVMRKTTNVT